MLFPFIKSKTSDDISKSWCKFRLNEELIIRYYFELLEKYDLPNNEYRKAQLIRNVGVIPNYFTEDIKYLEYKNPKDFKQTFTNINRHNLISMWLKHNSNKIYDPEQCVIKSNISEPNIFKLPYLNDNDTITKKKLEFNKLLKDLNTTLYNKFLDDLQSEIRKNNINIALPIDNTRNLWKSIKSLREKLIKEIKSTFFENININDINKALKNIVDLNNNSQIYYINNGNSKKFLYTPKKHRENIVNIFRTNLRNLAYDINFKKSNSQINLENIKDIILNNYLECLSGMNCIDNIISYRKHLLRFLMHEDDNYEELKENETLSKTAKAKKLILSVRIYRDGPDAWKPQSASLKNKKTRLSNILKKLDKSMQLYENKSITKNLLNYSI